MGWPCPFPAADTRLREMDAARMLIVDMARELRVDRATIRKHRKRLGLGQRPPGMVPWVWTPERLAELARLRGEGLVYRVIAERMGAEYASVLGAAWRLRLPPARNTQLHTLTPQQRADYDLFRRKRLPAAEAWALVMQDAA